MPARKFHPSSDLRRPPRAVDDGAAPRRAAAVETRDQAPQARGGALLLRRSARRAARQDAGRRRRPARAMRAGVTMTSTLLAKDTSHRTVFPVFTAGGGMGLDEMAGAGNFIMVADPATFRVLPWASAHRLAAVRHLFPERQAGAVLDPGALSRRACEACGGGLRLSRRARGRVPPVQARRSAACAGRSDLAGRAAAVEHTTHGFQYLTEARFDQVDPILEVCARRCRRSACRCARSRWSSARASTNSPSRRRRDWRRPTPWCCSAAR